MHISIKGKISNPSFQKIKWKKIGPCKIIEKISQNAYELELPIGLGISPVFNVYSFHTYYEVETLKYKEKEEILVEIGMEQLLEREKKDIGCILESRVVSKIRGKEYKRYLAKQKRELVDDTTWLIPTKFESFQFIP